MRVRFVVFGFFGFGFENFIPNLTETFSDLYIFRFSGFGFGRVGWVGFRLNKCHFQVCGIFFKKYHFLTLFFSKIPFFIFFLNTNFFKEKSNCLISVN